jgi:hypothetical protein
MHKNFGGANIYRTGATGMKADNIVTYNIEVDVNKVFEFLSAEFFHQPGFTDLTGSPYYQRLAVWRCFPLYKLCYCSSFHISNLLFVY